MTKAGQMHRDIEQPRNKGQESESESLSNTSNSL